MEEAEATPVSNSPEDDEEQLISDNAFTGYSAEKQKKVLMKYIQEKSKLKEELEAKDKVIQEYKAKVYDLTSSLTTMEKELSQAKKEKNHLLRAPPLASRLSSSGSRSPAPQRTGIVRPSTSKVRATTARAKTARAKNKNKTSRNTPESLSSDTPEPINNEEELKAIKTLERYKDIAEKFPELKLSVTMRAEQVFFEADINHDGTIDEDELEKLLDKQGHLTTKREVKEIMREIDKDQTGTIDLMEYLAVMERVQQRKRTNLPPALTKSTVCAIQ